MKPNKGNQKKNFMGLVTILLWAMTFAMIFQSCSGSGDANEVHVDYSTFKQWVEEEKVEKVILILQLLLDKLLDLLNKVL